MKIPIIISSIEHRFFTDKLYHKNCANKLDIKYRIQKESICSKKVCYRNSVIDSQPVISQCHLTLTLFIFIWSTIHPV